VFSLGIDGAVVLPTGEWSNTSGVGLGALIKAEIEAIPMLSATRASDTSPTSPRARRPVT